MRIVMMTTTTLTMRMVIVVVVMMMATTMMWTNDNNEDDVMRMRHHHRLRVVVPVRCYRCSLFPVLLRRYIVRHPALCKQATFFTLKELETLGRSKGVIPQAGDLVTAFSSSPSF